MCKTLLGFALKGKNNKDNKKKFKQERRKQKLPQQCVSNNCNFILFSFKMNPIRGVKTLKNNFKKQRCPFCKFLWKRSLDKQLLLSCVSLWAIFFARRQIKIPKLMLPTGRPAETLTWPDPGPDAGTRMLNPSHHRSQPRRWNISCMALGINSTLSAPFPYFWLVEYPDMCSLYACKRCFGDTATLISLHINCDTCYKPSIESGHILEPTRWQWREQEQKHYLCRGQTISRDFD